MENLNKVLQDLEKDVTDKLEKIEYIKGVLKKNKELQDKYPISNTAVDIISLDLPKQK
jgi:hypothetical protein